MSRSMRKQLNKLNYCERVSLQTVVVGAACLVSGNNVSYVFPLG